MRTTVSPTTGIIWRLCAWDEVCQMPITTILSGGTTYCQWHRSCLNAPAHARNEEVCAMWLEWLQREYSTNGWWSLPIEQLWPVLQGVQTIWQVKQEAARRTISI